MRELTDEMDAAQDHFTAERDRTFKVFSTNVYGTRRISL